ncbi:hypothetical protein GE09DRAFT_1082095 [Coniochaeta sp. 2T2.1]|nr:hypothetical protein GE09DRAFT_1082095 [Coniochaeta sp. 2T2.1]
MSKFWPKGGLPGILHHYTETLVTFEYTSPTTTHKPHSLLFIGGLGDGLATTSYTVDLVRALAPTEWSFFTLNLTSSYSSWGTGHLDRDADEIAACARYIKEYKSDKFGGDGVKVVLMGHSTGSQCVLHYLSQPNPLRTKHAFDAELEHVERPAVDGAIMQAPVSDREAILWVLQHGFKGRSSAEVKAVWDKLGTLAKEIAAKGESSSAVDEILPLWMTSYIYPADTPISARRFLSLFSPDSPAAPGEDDMFSSDLADEQFTRTFGMVKDRGLLRHKLMVLMSGADQAVPDWIDKEALLDRWRAATDREGDAAEQIWDKGSGLIPNASHALSNDDQTEARRFLVGRVLGYLQGAEDV